MSFNLSGAATMPNPLALPQAEGARPPSRFTLCRVRHDISLDGLSPGHVSYLVRKNVRTNPPAMAIRTSNTESSDQLSRQICILISSHEPPKGLDAEGTATSTRGLHLRVLHHKT